MVYISNPQHYVKDTELLPLEESSIYSAWFIFDYGGFITFALFLFMFLALLAIIYINMKVFESVFHPPKETGYYNKSELIDRSEIDFRFPPGGGRD